MEERCWKELTTDTDNHVSPFLLSSVEVAFEEGPVNLNWSMIMKTVNEDPAEFYRNGGWNFLGPGSDVSIDYTPHISTWYL